MSAFYERTRILVHQEGIDRLRQSSVLIVGLGGVGGFVAEGLARAGVGELTVIDHDTINVTNINRQILALHSTLDQKKSVAMKERILDINPSCNVEALDLFIDRNNVQSVLTMKHFDYVVDAIDSLNCKVTLLENAYKLNLRTASSMGAGSKMDPTQIKIGDLFDTSMCSLARWIRKKLRPLGVERGIKVVYTTEEPKQYGPKTEVSHGRARVINGTISYMPAIFGLMLCGVVCEDLLAQ